MKRWYVAQVYPGYEDAVKKDLERRVKELQTDLIGQVLVPSARAKNVFFQEEGEEDERLFPGYILIEMDKTPDAMAIVCSTPKLSRFLGGREPVPLTKKEVARVLSQVSGEVVIASPKKEEFVLGSEIEINEGPFAGFVGIIDKIDESNEKLTVMVSIFGRLTPVELTFDQVKK